MLMVAMSWRQVAGRESVDLSGAGIKQCCWLTVEQQLRIRRIESGAEDRDDLAGRDGPGSEAGRIYNGDRRGFRGSRGRRQTPDAIVTRVGDQQSSIRADRDAGGPVQLGGQCRAAIA